mgnify:CR=1 FL=1
MSEVGEKQHKFDVLLLLEVQSYPNVYNIQSKEFKDTGLYWVEDKWQNAVDGLDVGLKPLLIDHLYNRTFKKRGIKRVKNWKQIRQLLVK